MQRWEQFDHRCAYCLAQFNNVREVTIEHLVGIQEGGTHRIENVVPACLKCNQQKGTRTVKEFTAMDIDDFIIDRVEKIEKMKEQKGSEDHE
jgi:5-methylcytosine-specific restriction endonuclease McrA